MSTITVLGPRDELTDEILTPEALAFLGHLHDLFAGRRAETLAADCVRADRIANGAALGFDPTTRAIREEPTWRVAGPGPGLERRHVEITGPTDPKMAINALNSGADVWLADHEDALSPTWSNVIGGQRTLRDAIRGTLEHTSPEGKHYRIGDTTPTIVFRPRGWHLTERHLSWTDSAGIRSPASATLVDAGLYLFHNAQALIDAGRGPYLYLPKTEHANEARLWDDVFTATENALRLEHGTIRATVLIETITAAFEMEEILFELRDHCAGLNAGRWDYLFSLIKNLRERGASWVLPDRARITMTAPFMRAYTELLVSTCHRRGAYAIGGMSAFIPDRRDPERSAQAIEQVRQDKRREASDGFDGTWVAHPGLIAVAREEFDRVLGDRDAQLDRLREEVRVTAKDLLDVRSVSGGVTDAGVAANTTIALRYIESWLRGTGAAALDGLMEDAATAEISRAQLWQWIRYGVVTQEGTRITRASVERLLAAEVARRATPDGRYEDAAEIVRAVALDDDFPPFLTIPAYAAHLVTTAQPVPTAQPVAA